MNEHLPNPRIVGREYQKIATVWACQMERSFSVVTLEGTMRGREGDYLCKGPNGELWPVKKEIFESTYEPHVRQWSCGECGETMPLEEKAKHEHRDCQAFSDTSTVEDRA